MITDVSSAVSAYSEAINDYRTAQTSQSQEVQDYSAAQKTQENDASKQEISDEAIISDKAANMAAAEQTPVEPPSNSVLNTSTTSIKSTDNVEAVKNTDTLSVANETTPDGTKTENAQTQVKQDENTEPKSQNEPSNEGFTPLEQNQNNTNRMFNLA